MARAKRKRIVRDLPEYVAFLPDGIPPVGEVVMGVDEFEAVRLLDYEHLSQKECAERMGIARTTVTAIYESARAKVADSLVNGRRLVIAGGSIRLHEDGAPPAVKVPKKPEGVTRLALPVAEGAVFQHFGRTEAFLLVDCADGRVLGRTTVSTGVVRHAALSGFLADCCVDVVICGGIGSAAQSMLAAAHIRFCGGQSGDADKCIDDWLAGRLEAVEAAGEHIVARELQE